MMTVHPTARLKRFRIAPWLLASIVGILCLWGAVKSGLAWPWLPGAPHGAQLLALLAPQAPGQPHPQPSPVQASPPGQKEHDGPKHPLIQALLQALDAFHGEGQDAKDALRNRLHQADHELRTLLTDRKEKILQLNKKPVLPLMEEPSRVPPTQKPSPPAGSESAPSAKPKPPQPIASPPQTKSSLPIAPSAKPTKVAPSSEPSKPAAKASEPAEVQTALVRALLEVLDKLNDVSEEDRRQVRQLLLEADKDLAKALESRSPLLPKGPPRSK